MTGDTLGAGQFGPKVPLQVTTESRTVAKGQSATFYVPQLGTSNVQCKKGYYYQATTAIYATTTLLTKTTVDVFSSARVKLC